MRSRSHFIIVGFVVLAAFALAMMGCSDDKPAPTQTNTGGTNDTIANPQFSAVQSELEDFVNGSIGIVNDGLSMGVATIDQLNDIVFGPFVPTDSSSADWKVYYLLQAGTQVFGLDSIQFLKNGVPQPDGIGANRIDYIHYYKFNTNDTMVTFRNSDTHSDFTLTGLAGSAAAISGTHNLTVTDKFVSVDSTVWWTFDIQASYSNMVVNKSGNSWNRGCPSSGTATVTIDASYKKDTASAVQTSWQFDLTFTDGTMDVNVTFGTDSASYSSQLCTVN